VYANDLKIRIQVLVSFIVAGVVSGLSVKLPYSGDQVLFWANLTTHSTLHPSGYFWNSVISYLGHSIQISAPFIVAGVQGVSAFICIFALSQVVEWFWSFVGAIFWLLSFGVFRYFLIYEGRTLIFVFLSLFLWALKKYQNQSTERNRWKVWLCLLLGFVQHHLLAILLSTIYLHFFYKNEKSLKKPLIHIFLALIMSIVPILFLGKITQAHTVNLISWGDLQSLTGMWRHWSRAELGSFSLAQIPALTYFSALKTHLFELFKFLVFSTLGTIFVLFIPKKNKNQSVLNQSILVGFFVYTFVLLIFGNIEPSETWYRAILLRFWIIPSPILFVLIGDRVALMNKKKEWIFVLAMIILVSVNIRLYAIQDYRMTHKKIFELHPHLIGDLTPRNALVLHSSYVEWVRTILWINQNEKLRLSYQNSFNGSYHLLVKSILQYGWPTEQVVTNWNQSGKSAVIKSDQIWDQLRSLWGDRSVVLIGPASSDELHLFLKALDLSAHPIGPYFLLNSKKNSPSIELIRLNQEIQRGIQSCDLLLSEWSRDSLDSWIEPMTDYFCYPCLLTFQLTHHEIKDEWKKACAQK